MMWPMMWRSTILLALAATTACGSVAELRPRQGMGQVPTAAAAPAPETPTQLMTPDTQAQPDRQAELLTRSVERKDDPFDLPPGPDNGRVGDD